MRLNEIVIAYGDNPKEMVRPILAHMGVGNGISKNDRIGIKPNLVVAKPSDSGATSDPAIVFEIVDYLHGKGLHNIVIFESAWLGDSTTEAFRVCGYTEKAKEYSIPLVDLKTDSVVRVGVQGGDFLVCERALKVDHLINVPVLKAHCQTKLTCALKNLKGCIPDSEKRRYHAIGLHKPIAQLNTIIKTHLVVVDGIIGDLTHEEGGNPVVMNRIIAGADPVLVDSYAATLLGYGPSDIEHVCIAQELGVGSADLSKADIVEINQPGHGKAAFPASRSIRDLLGRWVVEDMACSACLGSLVHALARLKETGGLHKIQGKLAIGQGFCAKSGKGIGIGACTRGFDDCVDGCPPTAQMIVDRVLKRS